MSKNSIVILGANGNIGKHAIRALLSSPFKDLYAHPLRIVTRDATKAAEFAPTGSAVEYFTADIASGDGLAKAFSGVDVVVNLLGATVSHTKVADAAAAAHAKLYIPSEFGTYIPGSGEYANLFKSKTDHLKYAQSLGLKTVAISTGGFAEFIFKIPFFAGINFPPGQFQYYGDIDTKLSVTSLVDLGKVVASVATKDPATVPAEVNVSSADPSLRELKEAYEKATGTKLTPNELPLKDVVAPALKIAQEGPKGREDFVAGLKGVIYSGKIYHVSKDNEYVTKGLFEFTPLDKIAENVLKN